MNNLPVVGLTTHTRQVQSLYKRVLRNIESWVDRKDVYRYYTALARARFDRTRHIKDMYIAKQVLQKGEVELFSKRHYDVRKFPTSSFNGTAFDRVVPPTDWALDHWHVLEKAQYPEYFQRREQRKKDFVKLWESEYANPKI